MKKTQLKNIGLGLTLVSGIALAFASCKKEPLAQTEPADNSSTSGNYKTISGQLTPRPLSISDADLLLYQEDANLEKIDMARYCLGNAFKDVLTQNMISYIVSQNNAHPHYGVKFSELFTQFPGLLSSVNQKLASQSNQNIPYDFSNFSKVEAALEREGIKYDPGVYVPNLGTFGTSTSKYILTPAIELEDDQGFKDQLMGWFKNGATTSRIKVNESEANTMGYIVMTIDLLVKGANLGTPQPIGSHTPLPAPTGGNKYMLEKVRVWQKFERRGESEIYAHIAVKSGTSWVPKYTTFSPATEEWSAKLINTRDMGNWHTVNKEMTVNAYDVVWNVFERDWWASFKVINDLSVGGYYPIWGAPMTFATEYYAIHPRDNDDSPSNPYYMGPYKASITTSGTHMNISGIPGEFIFKKVPF